MGYFRDSVQEVQECIDGIESARIYKDAELRRAAASEVLPKVRRLRIGKGLEPQIRKLIEADNLERAVKLLSFYQQHRGFRLGVVPAVVIPIGVAVYFLVVPRLGGHHDAVLDAVVDCPAATDRLGDEVRMPLFGLPTGSTRSNSGMSFAQWSIPVEGTRESGRCQYMADELDGEWTVNHASLQVGDEHILVVPCWGKVSDDDAAGRLRAGHSAEGTITAAKGDAPAKVGDSCQVKIDVEPDYPAEVPYNCRIELSCGGVKLYGATPNTGFAFCHAKKGLPISAFDRTGTEQGGDPILEMDLERRQIRLADDGTGSTYEITVGGL